MSELSNGAHSAEILVVDDIIGSLKLLNDILTNQGYKVRPARDGTEALHAISNREPELVLLDINMPGIDGYEVCRQLKSDPETSDIPIIFITASMEPEAAVKAFKLGAVDYTPSRFSKRRFWLA